MKNDDAVATQLSVMEETFGWCELDDLTVFRVVGEAARETLQRVVSQDVAGLDEGRTTPALVLTATGQCRALMAVLAVEGGLLLAAPPGRDKALRATLEKFLLLSRCRLEEVSVRALAVVGRNWPAAVGELGADASAVAAGGVVDATAGGLESLAFPAALLGLDGAVVTLRDVVADGVRQRLRALVGRPLSRESLELDRIRRGRAAWGGEVAAEFLPHEIGLDRTAVSTRKGCYIGQETMARLETYGRPNRGLVGLLEIGDSTTPPGLPAELTAEGDETVRGAITSWGNHPEIGGVALAVVRRSHAEEGTVLVAGDRRYRVGTFSLW